MRLLWYFVLLAISVFADVVRLGKAYSALTIKAIWVILI
jgi:hypothetical protein